MAAVECKSCGNVFELTEQRHYIANERKRVFSKGDKNDTRRSD